MKLQCHFVFAVTSFLPFLMTISTKGAELVPKPPLVLAQGEQRLLQIPGLLRYSVGDPILKVYPLKKSVPSAEEALLVKGLKPGRTDLWVWKTDGSTEFRPVRIEKWAPEGADGGLRRELDLLQEVEVIASGPGVILRGEVRSWEEAKRVGRLADAYRALVKNETLPTATLLAQGRERIEAWLKTSSYRDKIWFEERETGIWVRGSATSPQEQVRLEAKLKSLFPLVESDVQSLPDDAPTIYFRVFLLELRRSEFGALGVRWPAEQEGAFRVTSSAVASSLQLDLTLQALEGKGAAKILSRPELAVRAPGEAELFAGGEIPIRTKTHYMSQVNWKQFGVSLKLKITHVAGEKIRADISTEVSQLDSSLSQDDIPGMQANRMRTQVDAKFGKPLLLSGLLQQGMRDQAKGLPLLRQIPVLGLLFGSEDYLNNVSELVAILLPYAAPPTTRWTLPRGPLPLPRDWTSPAAERQLRNSPGFPWTALE
jgi:Flp pilus assembly secretin CpaC